MIEGKNAKPKVHRFCRCTFDWEGDNDDSGDSEAKEPLVWLQTDAEFMMLAAEEGRDIPTASGWSFAAGPLTS